MAGKRKRPGLIERPLVERDPRVQQRDRDMAEALRGYTGKSARGPAARGRVRSVFQ